MNQAPLQTYLDKWLTVHPEQRQALVFLDPAHYPGHLALAALEQELIGAAYGIHELDVAGIKLHWWREELAGAAATGGRHPLLHILYAQPRARTLPATLWLAPATAALSQLEQGSSADYPAQLAAHAPFHQALASLETAWWYGPEADSSRAAQLATVHHLFHSLQSLAETAAGKQLPLPMAALARHGLSRQTLSQPSPARSAALREQLQRLLQSLQAAQQASGPLSVFRSLEAWHVRRQARAAWRADDPLLALQALPHRPLGSLIHAWRAARRWRQLEPQL